jgi:hypothetical protein
VYKTTLAATANSVVISGLSGDTDQIYRLTTRVVGSVNADYCTMQLNNDTAWGYQYLDGSDATVSAARSTDSFVYLSAALATAGAVSMSTCLIYAKSGYVRPVLQDWTQTLNAGTTVGLARLTGWSWNNTASSVSTIDIESYLGWGIGIGTYICLERLNL